MRCGVQTWISAGQKPNFADALVNLRFAAIVLKKLPANTLKSFLRNNDSTAA
jgi:hypothetical protein